ncbi:MAG: protein kinase domain-containing protein, partial [Planctomycetota bacterium]
LHEAHRRKIIHRDIKPSNILIDARGRARLVDFGLATTLEEHERLTRTGDILGTPWYMSPEQAFGDPREIDARTDVYSLGAVLYEMLTGRPPFEGTRSLEVLKKIEVENPLEPSRIRPGLDPALDALVLRALAKDPSKRYADAGQFARALRAATAGTRGISPASPRWALRVAAASGLAAAAFAAGYAARPAAPPAPRPSETSPSEGGVVGPATVPAPAESSRTRAERIFHAFLRYELCQGNIPRSWFHPVPSLLGLEKDLDDPRSGGASADDIALGELVLLSFQQSYREIAERTGLPDTPASRLVRAHAEFRRALEIRDDSIRRSRLTDLRADLEKRPVGRYGLFVAALAAIESGDGPRAQALAQRLVDRTCAASSEPYLLRAVVFDRLHLLDRLTHELEIAHAVDPEDPLPASYLQAARLSGDSALKERSFAARTLSLLEGPAAGRLPYPAPALLVAAARLLQGKLTESEQDFQRIRARFGKPRAGDDDDDGIEREINKLVIHAGGKGPQFAYTAGLILSRAGLEAAEETLRTVESRLSAPDAARAFVIEPDELRDMLQTVYHELAALSLRRGSRDAAVDYVGKAVRAGAEPDDLAGDERLSALRGDPRVAHIFKRP